MVTVGQRSMQAIVQDEYGDEGKLRLEEVNVPTPGNDEVLVRVHTASAHLGDWHLMSGLPYLVRVIGNGLRRPRDRVRGWDLSGTVESVGAGVTGFRPGDRIFGSGKGAFAEFALARPDHLAVKPEGLGFADAATLPTSAVTALQAMRPGDPVSPGDRVLVIGAGGGVGSFAVQLAKAFGAEVTAVCSTDKVDLVSSLGADKVVDYTREDITTSGLRFDRIVDTAGLGRLSRLRRLLEDDGVLVIVGGEGGGRMLGMVTRSLRAVLLSPLVAQKLVMLVASVNRADLEELAGLVESGVVTPVVGKTVSLKGVPEAIAYLATGHATGKVVVEVMDQPARRGA